MEIEYESSIIMEKNNFKIIKKGKNTYSLMFEVENNNIILPKIINFSLASLIYELNKDIFEDFKMDIINETEVNMYSLFKHFFKDVGLPQRYSFLKVNMLTNENNIIFTANTIYDNLHPPPSKISILPVENMIMTCTVIQPHKVAFISDLCFNIKFDIPIMFEKLATTIFSKIFMRIKQFIENIR